MDDGNDLKERPCQSKPVVCEYKHALPSHRHAQVLLCAFASDSFVDSL